MDVASIARSGMAAASAQLSVVASNLANQQSRAGPDPAPPAIPAVGATSSSGAPYVPLRAMQTSVSSPSGAAGTQVSVEPDPGAVTQEYDPEAPYADPHGYAAVPDVDVLKETVDGIMATFAFDANLAVLATADEMTRTFLQETGRATSIQEP